MKKIAFILLINLFLLTIISRDMNKNNVDYFSNWKYLLNTIDEVLEYTKKDSLNEEEKNLFSKYPDFKKYLIRANIPIPIKDNMIPQGITVYKNLLLITAYDSLVEKVSVCYVLTKYGKLVKTIDLKTKAHVGSIVYDNLNKLIWLPDINGSLKAYRIDDFLLNDKILPIYTFEEVGNNLPNYVNKEENEIAFLDVNDNNIYLGSFNLNSKGLVKQYQFSNNNLIHDNNFSIPSKVQSISIVKKDNINYMLLSRSYGRNNDSYLEIYTMNNNKNIKIKTLVMPPMLEQITIDNDKLYAIFESNALKYIESKYTVKDICVFDLNKILEL